MGSSLEADILKKIPDNVSEMYAAPKTQEATLKLSIERYISRFLLVSLNIDAIFQEATIHRQQKLNEITDSLGWGMLMEQL